MKMKTTNDRRDRKVEKKRKKNRESDGSSENSLSSTGLEFEKETYLASRLCKFSLDFLSQDQHFIPIDQLPFHIV
jgi:hypothetical protein